jgi:hypothetical protein
MSEELTTLLKELVDRVKRLETTVFNADNIIMKSGFVKVESPSPRHITSDSLVPDSDTIAKMDWEDIDSLVKKLQGEA